MTNLSLAAPTPERASPLLLTIPMVFLFLVGATLVHFSHDPEFTGEITHGMRFTIGQESPFLATRG